MNLCFSASMNRLAEQTCFGPEIFEGAVFFNELFLKCSAIN
jgi:hypothetical protein